MNTHEMWVWMACTSPGMCGYDDGDSRNATKRSCFVGWLASGAMNEDSASREIDESTTSWRVVPDQSVMGQQVRPRKIWKEKRN